MRSFIPHPAESLTLVPEVSKQGVLGRVCWAARIPGCQLLHRSNFAL